MTDRRACLARPGADRTSTRPTSSFGAQPHPAIYEHLPDVQLARRGGRVRFAINVFGVYVAPMAASSWARTAAQDQVTEGGG